MKTIGNGLPAPDGRPLILQRGSGPQKRMMCMAGHHNQDFIGQEFQYLWSVQAAQFYRSPHWDKWFLLSKYLNNVPDGTVICWLDADCLLLRDYEVPEGEWDFAACRTESGQRWQIGACWFKANLHTRRLCESIYINGPLHGSDVEDDQQRFNKMPLGRIWPRQLESEWNFWGGRQSMPSGPVMVASWHGFDNEIACSQMASVIKSLGKVPVYDFDVS